jgi:hypothetical protein
MSSDVNAPAATLLMAIQLVVLRSGLPRTSACQYLYYRSANISTIGLPSRNFGRLILMPRRSIIWRAKSSFSCTLQHHSPASRTAGSRVHQCLRALPSLRQAPVDGAQRLRLHPTIALASCHRPLPLMDLAGLILFVITML